MVVNIYNNDEFFVRQEEYLELWKLPLYTTFSSYGGKQIFEMIVKI